MPVGQLNAIHETLQRLGRRRAIDDGLVLLLHARAGVRHRVGPVAVVGHQQQPFGIAIEPAHREQPLGTLHQRKRGRTPLWIAGRRHHARRLVQQHVNVSRRRRQRPPIHCDYVTVRVGLRARFGRRAPVHGNAPLGHQPLGAAPRGHPCLGQYLMQSHGAFRRTRPACARPRHCRLWSVRPRPRQTTRSARCPGEPTACRRRSVAGTSPR